MQTQRCRPVSELCPVGEPNPQAVLACILIDPVFRHAITGEDAPLKSPIGIPEKNFSCLFLKILTLLSHSLRALAFRHLQIDFNFNPSIVEQRIRHAPASKMEVQLES
jgi:hypothetical protein